MSIPALNILDLKQSPKPTPPEITSTTITTFYENNKDAISAILPAHLHPERILKIAFRIVRTTPRLLECSTQGLFGAIVQCAQLGLEPNTPMGHAHIIPFHNARENKTDVQVIVGYRGLIDLARRSGQIISIASHAVRAEDKFRWEYGLDEQLSHRPAPNNRGEITHFYAVARLKDGGYAFEVMTRDEIERIRETTRSYRTDKKYGRQGIWEMHFEEMGRKTVIRRLFKFLPVSIELATATALDSMAEAGKSQHLESTLQGEWTTPNADNETTPTESQPESQPESPPEKNSAPKTESPEKVAEPQNNNAWPEIVTIYETGKQTWIDVSGTTYNPELHAWSTSHKQPSISPAGLFRPRRRKNHHTQHTSSKDAHDSQKNLE